MNLKEQLAGKGPMQWVVGSESEVVAALAGLAGTRPIRHLRSSRCGTVGAMYDELAASLQFPPSFGANWDALRDCLADLSWLGERGEGPVLCFLQAQDLLKSAGSDQLDTLRKVLEQVVEDWRQSTRGESKRFQVLFQVEPTTQDNVRKRFQSANFHIS
jgi:hypothetical protein